MGARLGIEVGGTFTDLILIGEDGAVAATGKAFSTPDDPARGVVEVMRGLGERDLRGVALVHGSTVATNAVLERRGPRLGFLATQGFRDILELQRQDRESIYDLRYTKPRPLAARDACAGVRERVDAGGNVLSPLDEEQARAAIRSLLDRGVESIAVCLLHGYRSPGHEERVRELVTAMAPGVAVSISSEVAAEFREYERASTTTVDAFVKPVVSGYVARLDRHAAETCLAGLSIMQSNGGLLPAGYVTRHPVRMLFSGPAAGVTGAVRVAAALGLSDLVTMDMGGTSTDVCLVDGGRPSVTADATLDRLPVRVPMVDIVSVGAGGGSVVDVDSGGMLQVGPRSAGAQPGPACYGRGGRAPTTTDANVVRGLLRPDHFLGGRLRLRREAAHEALARVAGQAGRSVDRLAEDVFRVANTAMAAAVRVVSVERGRDPRDYTLVAYGGAGPLHAAGVAEELSMRRVLIPPHPGLISACGLLVAPFQRDFAQTQVTALEAAAAEDVLASMARLEERARAEVTSQGVPWSDLEPRFAIDMRYRGQGFELTVPVAPGWLRTEGREGLAARFHETHLRRYGHARPGERAELVTYRLSVLGPPPASEVPRSPTAPPQEPVTRPLLIDGTTVTGTFLWRPSLTPGTAVDGPAVVEEDTSTVYVPPGWRALVDATTCLVLERRGT